MPTDRLNAIARAGIPPTEASLASHCISPIRLHHLELQQFRNYQKQELRFETPRLLVIGNNGEGKSNLLEAVELLGSLRSHRTSHDRELIRQGQSISIVKGVTYDQDLLELEFRTHGGRQVKRNGKRLNRQHDLLHSLRCVGFSSLDLELIRGEPAQRRQWLDKIVLQLEPIYNELITRYSKLLKQRSQLLRRGLNQADLHELLDIFDQQLSMLGARIYRRRYRALNRLEPIASYWQEYLSNGREQLMLIYKNSSNFVNEKTEAILREILLLQLRDQREQELRTYHCLIGPHRDEVDMLLGGMIARRYASAGQQKTLILSLKMAEMELISQVCGQPPILLLDDVMAELDLGRQELLLEAIGLNYQCLVSATTEDVFTAKWRQDSQIIKIVSGQLRSVEQN